MPGIDPRGTWDWHTARQRCLRIARAMTNDEHDAQDIAQEALVRAWRHRATVRSSADRAAWLATITRNEARRLHSRRAATVPVAEIERYGGAVNPPGDGIEAVDIRLALEGLDPLDRTIALLRYREDLTQPRIAQLLEMPEGTVKVRLHRLRHKLRTSLSAA